MKRKVLLSTLFLILHFTVALAQQVTISGQVLDEKSEPLIGATINIIHLAHAALLFKLRAALEIFPAVVRALGRDRKSTRLNSSHYQQSRMPSSA